MSWLLPHPYLGWFGFVAVEIARRSVTLLSLSLALSCCNKSRQQPFLWTGSFRSTSPYISLSLSFFLPIAIAHLLIFFVFQLLNRNLLLQPNCTKFIWTTENKTRVLNDFVCFNYINQSVLL